MTLAHQTALARLKYDRHAYQFVDEALRYTQKTLGRREDIGDAHISGEELLEGIREFALENFGLMTITVFRQWGIAETDDFGRIVFEMVERGQMKKTEDDQLSDFASGYDFEDAFDRDYRIDTSHAFSRS